jgi:hypothetical protein
MTSSTAKVCRSRFTVPPYRLAAATEIEVSWPDQFHIQQFDANSIKMVDK